MEVETPAFDESPFSVERLAETFDELARGLDGSKRSYMEG